MGGLSESTRAWYCKQILIVLKKYQKATLATILAEMRRIPQNRYPVQEERVCAFLKYLRAIGVVSYTKSPIRKVGAKWQIKEKQ